MSLPGPVIDANFLVTYNFGQHNVIRNATRMGRGMMTGDQIRQLYTRFFEERGHLRMPSASLIPAGDPTLLFTSAGMVPFKPFFMGEQTPPSRRLTSIQKSFRTTDIDEVGDHKHLTFFEMLGNFSIGDYFKNDAVAFAWELMTQGFGLEADRIFVTIHLDDDEAYGIWRDQIGIPPERIYRYGDSDNWWGPAGTEGPTGPCSELHYDGGAEKGCSPMLEPDALTALLREERDSGTPEPIPGCHPNCDCERFIELWNLVFMQFYQDPERNRSPLPAPSVDTGMGLERAAAVLQEKSNVFETDLLWPMVAKACELTGKSYGADSETDYSLRVVAEHSRAATFLIGDGVVPGNEGRGYVLRRVVRRAIRYGRRLGLDGPFLSQVAEVVIDNFQSGYRELSENRDFILRVVRLEEERFADSFERGSEILRDLMALRAVYIEVAEECEARRVELPTPVTIGGIDSRYPTHDSNFRSRWGSVWLPTVVQRNRGLPLFFECIPMMPHPLKPKVRCTGTRSPSLAATLLELEQELYQLVTGEAFILYDTYGFPPELTAEIAREAGMEVDMEGFQQEMDSRREQSRASASQAFGGSMEMLSTYENLEWSGPCSPAMTPSARSQW